MGNRMTTTIKPPKRGLVCPHCKVGKLRTVVGTRRGKTTFYIRRRRVCDECDQRTTTHERVLGHGVRRREVGS